MHWRTPRDDFDDGGTPAWRARHASTINARPRGVQARIRRMPLIKVIGCALLIGFSGLIVMVAGMVTSFVIWSVSP
jgi:hypothetical protein